MANKHTFKRTHFFINRKLQGRYLLTFLIPMLIMLLFMMMTLYFTSNNLTTMISHIIKVDIQGKMALYLQGNDNPDKHAYEELLNDINAYLQILNKNTHFKNAVITSMVWIFGIGIFFIIIQICLLTVFFSHKIAGPLYRFEMVFHSVIAGKYTEAVKLRHGDEMQNLAMLINESLEKTKERFNEIKKCTSLEEVKKNINALEV